jgi:hypothetical protein
VAAQRGREKNQLLRKSDMEHPLVATAYRRWRTLPRDVVLSEMAVLFHLAVKIDDVAALDRPAIR